MKTYKKIIELPRLSIQYDQDAESPRTWDTIGYFFTKESRNLSPDGRDHSLYQIMIDTQDEATDTEDHMARIKQHAEEQGYNITHIFPVYRHEHGSVVYKRGTAQGFDYSNCGFYIVTTESNQEELSTENIEKEIDAELENYTKWYNGDIYRFTLLDQNGEHIESCGDFYDIEDIRYCLPEEYANDDLYNYIQT